MALSFAGAQRPYVEQVAAALKARGVRCFYDADEQIELWGKYLAEELPTIYGEQAAAVVMFVSAEYAARDWTRHERRAALVRAVRERREYVLPARFDDTPLPGLLPDVSYVDLRRWTPQQFAAMIAAKLATLGITTTPSADEGGPARDTGSARPAGAVRVGEADPRRLGVHTAISVPGVPDDVLPEYVPRDADADVGARVAAAKQRGGFALLVGGSSVGKTRSAFQAVKELLPDWWLVHPAGPAEVAALAQVPSPRTVLWLDELQRYLDGDHGLTGGMMRALLGPPHPAVIIGTLWPELYFAYTTLPAPGAADPHAREREVVKLADVIRIGPEFSPAEQGRARAAAFRDRRLAIALEAAGYGLTQTLAAAPQLVARWENARTANPYGCAVLTAALDAARLGARAPQSADFLRAAAPAYCTSQQLAEAPDHWFEQALAYATEKLNGAVAALSPAGSRIGQVDGYIPADYLIQHASRKRRSARVPASTWDAILSGIRDPADAARLADNASKRLLYRYAIPMYRRAADAGDGLAAGQLAELLAMRGDLDGATQILRVRADAGDKAAASRLAMMLADHGDLEELRARAGAGDRDATRHLAGALAGRGDLDEAAQILRTRADAGDGEASWRLADLLARRGDLDGATQILRTRADAGDRDAAKLLADLLAGCGDLEGLCARADAGDEPAASRLADLLAERGDLDGLRARADAGDEPAASRLAVMVAERHDLDEAMHIARAWAAVGNEQTAELLARLLAERGDLGGLRARADAGDGAAASRLADLLAKRGDADELRARADAGDEPAASWLAVMLAERDDLDGLRARADADGEPAALMLAGMLADRGDLDGLRARADVGDGPASQQLADLLARRGDLEGLRARIDVGAPYASSELTELLIKQGRNEEAERLRRFGLNPDGSIACT